MHYAECVYTAETPRAEVGSVGSGLPLSLVYASSAFFLLAVLRFAYGC